MTRHFSWDERASRSITDADIASTSISVLTYSCLPRPRLAVPSWAWSDAAPLWLRDTTSFPWSRAWPHITIINQRRRRRPDHATARPLPGAVIMSQISMSELFRYIYMYPGVLHLSGKCPTWYTAIHTVCNSASTGCKPDSGVLFKFLWTRTMKLFVTSSSLITSMPVLLTAGPKCTLAASYADPSWVTVSMCRRNRRTDKRTPDRYITLSATDAATLIQKLKARLFQ